MWYVCDVGSGVCPCQLFVVRGCAVSRKYINDCNIDVFSVIIMYIDYLKFCVVCIHGRRYVCCSECYVVSNECDEHTLCLVQPIGAHGGEVRYLGFTNHVGTRGVLDVCLGCGGVGGLGWEWVWGLDQGPGKGRVYYVCEIIIIIIV